MNTNDLRIHCISTGTGWQFFRYYLVLYTNTRIYGVSQLSLS